MKFLYYPGCSLEGTAVEYNHATRAVMRALGAELIEIEDWTCCGASAGEAVSHLLSLALPARNLALAQKSGIKADIVVPCSACYLNLRRVDDHMARDSKTAEKINEVLKEEKLAYGGGIRSRHLLDVLANDVGAAKISKNIKKSLVGMAVVPYYGCQALRPYGDYDDPQEPVSMEPLIQALGAEVHRWSMGAKCCGAGLMTTKKDLGLELAAGLLEAASGADCIATVCPMCQMNLESRQKKISRMRGKDLSIPVLYLPQLIGVALGLSEGELGLDLNLATSSGLWDRFRALPQQTPARGAGAGLSACKGPDQRTCEAWNVQT